jgi:hypothetical protein
LFFPFFHAKKIHERSQRVDSNLADKPILGS